MSLSSNFPFALSPLSPQKHVERHKHKSVCVPSPQRMNVLCSSIYHQHSSMCADFSNPNLRLYSLHYNSRLTWKSQNTYLYYSIKFAHRCTITHSGCINVCCNIYALIYVDRCGLKSKCTGGERHVNTGMRAQKKKHMQGQGFNHNQFKRD